MTKFRPAPKRFFHAPRFRMGGALLATAAASVLSLVALGILTAKPAFAASIDGAGTMTVTPTAVTSGSTGNQFTFTFTNNASSAFGNNSKVMLTIPSGWTAPSTSNTTVSAGTCTGVSATPSIAGQAITVVQTCAPQKSFTITYGATGQVAAPNSAGTYTFSTTSSDGPSGGKPITTNPTVTVTASKLTFTTSPSNSPADTAFATQPVVAVQDASGNTVTSDSSAVTLALTTPNGATLSCTPNPINAVNGVATFTGCAIDKAGTYTLTATDGSLTPATSNQLTVSIGTATKLAFATQPSSSAAAGAAFAKQPVVSVQDAGGNTVTNNSSSVALALTAANGATLSCTNNPVNAVNGVATFDGCKIDKVGTYTLTATDGSLTSALSTSVTINAALASKLAFVQGPPSSAYAGTAMTPAVTVQVQDSFGNAVSASGVSVTLAPSSGVIDSGATATTTANGLATFSGVTINKTALGLTLSASSSGLTSATSGIFNVTVQVTSSSAALTTTASDAGSGVQTVAYFYCAGYSGSCTSATWTLIGSSTTATGNYPVTWTGQPGNGAYQVVAVATDNVGNTSAASSSTPVTVAN